MTRSRLHSQGFNLIEVMVALIVISVGLLGIAKMQALAMASTGTAKTRSIAALEAASLASTLRADRTYWGAIAAPGVVTVTFSNGAVTAASDGALLATPTCESAGAPCTTVQIAAYDLNQWVQAVATQMPTYTGTLTCTAVAAKPVTCSIVLNWTENRVAINSQSAGQNAQTISFSLYTEP